ncbi:DUF6220 domain-containing protein [Streptomyces sp. NRRL F-5123]|uniref:DUF6220 domain-containing protein n=1 Tax=Streptomyces sp. NRRL F-5123 TaxID=1463856 RepID=UPI000693FD8D|nr:DUF6220 domain-containing protein [Streptomyces sp. NRRL F-5123]
MRKVFLVLCVLLLVAIGVQFYLAGVAVFTKPQTDSTFDAHKVNGEMIILPLAVVATVVGAVAKVPRKLIGTTFLIALLVPVQVLINTIGGRDDDKSTTAGTVIMGFHVINGLIILLVARAAFDGTRALMKSGSGTRSAVTPAAPDTGSESAADPVG